MANEVVVDTSALIEYFFATEKGKVAKEIIESRDNAVLIPSIVIGEAVSKLERSGVENVDELIAALAEYSIIIPIEADVSFQAGKKHARLRKIEAEISLVDCLIMQIAEKHDQAMILAKDKHFKHYENAKLI